MSQVRKSHIVLLNGPPGSGKDTFARILMLAVRDASPATDVYIDRFAEPINRAIIAGHGLSDTAYATLERNKNHPDPLLFGRSLREARIRMGQEYFKPLYGETVFGRLLLDRLSHRDITSNPIVCIVPDLGFEAETVPLVNSPAGLTVVRIERDGHDFAKDSRSFVDVLGVHETIQNNGSVEALEPIARSLVHSRLRPWARGFTL